MIVDCHVHSSGNDKAIDILKAMDDAGIDAIFLFSYEYVTDPEKLRPELERLSRLCREAPDRLFPFALIDPRFPNAPETLDYAVARLGFRGLKMLPNHWYPYDDVAMRMYEKMQDLDIPGIFHSGILHGPIYFDSSRFCRPVYYEALLHFPRARFALAHIGWPWCEECVSVYGRFASFHREGGSEKQQMSIDLTPGGWSVDELRYTLERAGPSAIVYGSDTLTGTMDNMKSLQLSLEKHRRIFAELNVTSDGQARILGENVRSWLQ